MDKGLGVTAATRAIHVDLRRVQWTIQYDEDFRHEVKAIERARLETAETILYAFAVDPHSVKESNREPYSEKDLDRRLHAAAKIVDNHFRAKIATEVRMDRRAKERIEALMQASAKTAADRILAVLRSVGLTQEQVDAIRELTEA